MFQTLLDMIYPVRCPICGEIAIPKGARICPPCRDGLEYVGEPRCFKCGKPIEQAEQEYCGDCQRKHYHFEKGYAVWVYDDRMRHSIANFKYHGRKEYARFYIDEVLLHYGDTIRRLSPDALVPVPIHKSKHLERGYNQADILARGIGRELKLPVLSGLLVRNRKTLPQKALSDKERLKNLKEAFELDSREVKAFPGPVTRVLLVDDIYTTGSTLEACSQVLKANGISEVYFIVLCIGKGY